MVGEATPREPKVVLLISDEEATRVAEAILLHHHGFLVIDTGNVEQGIEGAWRAV